jgi:hypothetical protein
MSHCCERVAAQRFLVIALLTATSLCGLYRKCLARVVENFVYIYHERIQTKFCRGRPYHVSGTPGKSYVALVLRLRRIPGVADGIARQGMCRVSLEAMVQPLQEHAPRDHQAMSFTTT